MLAMMEEQNLLQTLLDHPRIALIFALVLGGLALAGKFSVTATRVMFFFAWAVAVFSFYGFFHPIFYPIRTKTWQFAACSIGFGFALFLLAIWAQPKALPLNFGRLVARRPILLWSFKEPKSVMEFGDSTVKLQWAGPQGQAMIKFAGDSDLTIERSGKKLIVSSKVRNQNGDLVAELIRNEWKVSATAWDRNYTDDALEVRDNRGKIVLQIKALLDRIQLQGEWWGPDGHGVRIAKCTDLHGQVGGCFIIMTPVYHPDDPVIQPIFEYPSDLHFGELKH